MVVYEAAAQVTLCLAFKAARDFEVVDSLCAAGDGWGAFSAGAMVPRLVQD